MLVFGQKSQNKSSFCIKTKIIKNLLLFYACARFYRYFFLKKREYVA